MKIEIYLEMEKGVRKGNSPYGPTPSSIRRRFGSQEESIFTVRESFSELAPEEKVVVETVQKYANAHSVEFRTYDVSRFRDGLRAFFKGVREVPTFVIGRTKLVGEVTESQIRDALGKA